ncbi:MAG: hypothetical protein J6P72_07090, partial [Firmicutes bacterium]|nr:hypothetical protein [Bacillota bacterium]
MSKFGKWTLGILFAGLIGAYITGNAYTRLRFFPGTTINGVDVGTLNAEQAEEKLNESAPYFSVIELDADTRDVKTEVIDLGDIGYEADYDTQSLLNAQPHMGWVKLLDGAPALTLEKTDFTYDPALLSQRIDQLYCMQPENQVEPVNAYLVGGENSVSIEEADDGCLLIEEPARELITQAIDQEKSSVDLTKACYAKASRTSDDQIYQAIAKRTVSIYNKTVTIQIYDDVYESFHDGTLRQMVTINEDLSYTIDEEALKSYVHALAEKYPNVIHRRGLLSSRGDVVSVGVAGDTYEYTFDEAATVDNIRQILLLIGDQQTFACWTRDVTVSSEVNGETITEVQKLPGLTRDEFGPGTDYGGTYIEISI